MKLCFLKKKSRLTALLLIAHACNLYFATNAHSSSHELRAKLQAAINASDSFKDQFDAEVWLVDMSSRLKPYLDDDHERLFLLREVHHEASRAGITPELVLAIIDIESRFDRFAISRAGAQGLMQIMPFWLKELDKPDGQLFDIKTNLRLGCTILKHYIDLEKGNLQRALARYNGSLGSRKYPEKIFAVLSKRWYKQ